MIIDEEIDYKDPYTFLMDCIDKKIPEKWNKWQKKELDKINFENINFENINFTNCSLNSVKFFECILDNTNLDNMLLNNVVFSLCQINIKFFKTNFYGVKFIDSRVNVEFIESQIDNCVFENLTIHLLKMYKCSLQRYKFYWRLCIT